MEIECSGTVVENQDRQAVLVATFHLVYVDDEPLDDAKALQSSSLDELIEERKQHLRQREAVR